MLSIVVRSGLALLPPCIDRQLLLTLHFDCEAESIRQVAATNCALILVALDDSLFRELDPVALQHLANDWLQHTLNLALPFLPLLSNVDAHYQHLLINVALIICLPQLAHS